MHLIPVIDMKTYEYLYSFLNLERVLDNLYSFCGAGKGKNEEKRFEGSDRHAQGRSVRWRVARVSNDY